ncbi:MAG: DUF1257 domain-containing protein [Pyrinomonadaceae bacterium]|jgi:hypothetical protein|nr:DUF1257 domain-containing protein [Pyrinomonadaceae bacterium]HMP64113.1 DUF1257 domain-containing protein [Pyrinomonadaceae bacterium]HMS11267.1 DUF1257 domain-containing protein [Pyrinomonadaceae bacterium]
MSKYMTFESQSFPNRELLLEALAECGFASPTVGTDIPLEGWDKRDPKTADVVIRRREVAGRSLLGDIGFQKTANGYVAIIDDLDLAHRLGKDFVIRLQNSYHEAAARKMAKKLGGTLIKERVGKTIKIRVKF